MNLNLIYNIKILKWQISCQTLKCQIFPSNIKTSTNRKPPQNFWKLNHKIKNSFVWEERFNSKHSLSATFWAFLFRLGEENSKQSIEEIGGFFATNQGEKTIEQLKSSKKVIHYFLKECVQAATIKFVDNTRRSELIWKKRGIYCMVISVFYK